MAVPPLSLFSTQTPDTGSSSTTGNEETSASDESKETPYQCGPLETGRPRMRQNPGYRDGSPGPHARFAQFNKVITKANKAAEFLQEAGWELERARMLMIAAGSGGSS